MKRRIGPMEEMAKAMVGDNKKPALYFVGDQGAIVTVTRSFGLAYAEWLYLARRRPLLECSLEDRANGVLASVEPEKEGSTEFRVYDDAYRLLKSS